MKRVFACAVVGVFVILPCVAASIPAWLDDGITKWNTTHPESKIQFKDIKDSFVWYDMPKGDLAHQQIRERVNDIVLANGYTPMDDEELVTTGKPPVTSGRVVRKKCWSRSFVLDLKAQENAKSSGDTTATQRQRLLTSLVCEDDSTWWAAFRVAG
jgi:hypothetical protein